MRDASLGVAAGERDIFVFDLAAGKDERARREVDLVVTHDHEDLQAVWDHRARAARSPRDAAVTTSPPDVGCMARDKLRSPYVRA